MSIDTDQRDRISNERRKFVYYYILKINKYKFRRSRSRSRSPRRGGGGNLQRRGKL
jgi:hypothetical protein